MRPAATSSLPLAIRRRFSSLNRLMLSPAGTRPRPQPNRGVAVPWRSPSGWPIHRPCPSAASTAPNPPISDSEDADLELEPHVVAAEGRFVLLCTRFASGDGELEYFMYKGDVKSPSLESIPLPEDRVLDGVNQFGILPLGDDYLLVGFYDDVFTLDYELRIYSSEDKTWRTEKLPNPCPRGDIIPEKVITLGEGVLGLVDFWHGMLVFNLLQQPLAARYIPLPDPLPENVRKLQVYNPGASPTRFRDLTCCNGVIKFIEMEHRVIKKESREIALEKPEDPSQKGVLYDSELIRQQKPIAMESKPKTVYSMNGWRVVTWTRAIESDCWLIGCSVDVDDLLVDNSFAAVLSSQSDGSLRNLSFKNMSTAWPILSPDGDDLLYLKATPKFRGSEDRWTVAVDLAEKTLKLEGHGVEARSFGRYIPSWQMYRPCALSKHLNMTPGIKVQAFCEITLAGTSVNDQNTAAVHVSGPDCCKTVNKRPRLSAEKVNFSQHGAQSVMQNAHILSLSEPNSCETKNKRPRLSAEKVNFTQNGAQIVVQNAETNRPSLSAGKINLAQNGAQSVVQNAHISAYPDQNGQPPIYPGQSWWPHEKNLPPIYPGQSWWPHENNLRASFQPTQQHFNRWGGSSIPGYVPIRAFGPAPNLTYGNYQTEWWQPPPSMQQAAPIRAFGPLKAPRLNNWYGASNHGYSQQLPAHNLNAYGLRLDNGNYQVQSQQGPPIQVLLYAALQQPRAAEASADS